MDFNDVLKVREEMLESVVSENLSGIDFVGMLSQSALLELITLSQELGLYN